MTEVDWISAIDMTVRASARAGMSPRQRHAHERLRDTLPAAVFSRPRAGELPRRVQFRFPGGRTVFLPGHA